MPPIVSQVAEHASSKHQELQRTISVLRARQYSNSSSTAPGDGGMMDPQPLDPNKIIGGHLLLGKRSSTPASVTSTNHYSNVAAVLNANFLSNGFITTTSSSSVSPTSSTGSGGSMADIEQNSSCVIGGGGGLFDMSGVGGGMEVVVHRRLDRSHSEPVWQQQQQMQLQDGRQGTNSSRYKTELCRPFEESGFCKYGDKCQFAHGGNELRTLNRHPKYKTELCRTFHTIGICPYGPRCHFIHNAEESRVLSPVMAAASMPPLHFAQHLAGGSPPPLVPSSALGGLQTITPPLGLPTIFDKHSPPSSIHGSPTSGGVFFDESAFSLFQGNILEGLAETLANSLHLNNKVNIQANFNCQINNNLNNSITISKNTVKPTLCSTDSNKMNGFSCSESNGGGFSSPDSSISVSPGGGLCDLLMSPAERQQAAIFTKTLEGLDTPPASPPDTSSSSTPQPIVSDRLPIFQSMNPVQ
uniref:Zinc finger protein 36, C3H1 type-like 1 n=1 Tax=Hirondellea gigas TaxID=1518452 RepID=A0A2P2HYW0_9CRUS